MTKLNRFADGSRKEPERSVGWLYSFFIVTAAIAGLIVGFMIAPRPAPRAVEKVVFKDKEKIVYQDREKIVTIKVAEPGPAPEPIVIEKPVERIVTKTVEKIVFKDRIVDRPVEKVVVKYVDRIVEREVPVETEKIVYIEELRRRPWRR